MTEEKEQISFVVEKIYDESGRIIGAHEYLQHPKSVGIIAFLEDRLIMVQQYRRAADMVTLEIPAGKVREGESLEQAVRRELQEEVGYDARNIELAFSFFPSPGMNTEQLFIYKASALVKSVKRPDEDEKITCVLLSKSEVKERLYNDIVDAKTLLALYFIGWI